MKTYNHKTDDIQTTSPIQAVKTLKSLSTEELSQHKKKQLELQKANSIEARRSELGWYVLFVDSQHEKKVKDAIEKHEANLKADRDFQKQNALASGMAVADPGADYQIEVFLPTKPEKRKWSDRIKTIDVVLTPTMLFLKMRLKDRYRIYDTKNHHIRNFLYSRELKDPERVPDKQMDQFMEMVSQKENLQITDPVKGDPVRIISGLYKGFTGELVRIEGKDYFQIRVGVKAALVSINRQDVVKTTTDDKTDSEEVRLMPKAQRSSLKEYNADTQIQEEFDAQNRLLKRELAKQKRKRAKAEKAEAEAKANSKNVEK